MKNPLLPSGELALPGRARGEMTVPEHDLKMVLGSQILESFSQGLWAGEKCSEC